MKHIIFGDTEATYDVAILIKTSSLKIKELRNHYTDKFSVPSGTKIIGFDLEYYAHNKCTISQAKKYLEILLAPLESLGVKTLFVCDAIYFKALTSIKLLAPSYGYVMPCTVKGYEYMEVILCPNYSGLFYNPAAQEHIDLAITTLGNHLTGTNFKLGDGIIHSADYCTDLTAMRKAFIKLHEHPELTLDVETFSLKFYEAGIGTFAFSWNKHNGVAFQCDYVPNKHPDPIWKGHQINNKEVKELLREFLDTYKGKLVYHNANFDIKVLVYELYMKDPLDREGMLLGIEKLTGNIDDTKIITYLATNSTAGNNLKLKHIAHGFAGNYAQDNINDIRKIELNSLLEYNLVDCLSTWYAKERYYQSMVDDGQLPIYKDILLPSVKVILQMELTGMPLDMDKVLAAKHKMEVIEKHHYKAVMSSPVIIKFVQVLRNEEFIKQNILWKRKQEPIEYFDYVNFNPASNPVMQDLLYTFLGYPVIDKTKSKAPAVGKKTLKKLLHLSTCKEHTELFENLIELADVSKILNTFIVAFIENSFKKADGIYWLHGSFNIGGTVSGRLSSSQPNLQNIPSTGSKYAKLIKECFMAPPGWLMVGADFASLEDRISALTTKDPNKLKVYTDGYDGHCLRAYSYYGSSMPDIINTVDSINSIAKLYPNFRQDSKAPTFLLTYQGTYHGLINNVGLPEKEAKAIEKKYHELYVVSDEWVMNKLIQATHDGYVTTAFGLRVRTPILATTILNKKATPYAAVEESRTAGNALGQGYGLLNNRAGIEFQGLTLASKYRLDILPIAHIHDAQYFIVKDNIGCVEWTNNNLVKCMQWQELPEIKHDLVKLGGDLEIYYPNWSNSYALPNNATKIQILDICQGSACE